MILKIVKFIRDFLTRFGKPGGFVFAPAELAKRCHRFLIVAAITAIAYGLVGLGYDVLSLELTKTQRIQPLADEATPAGSYAKPPAGAYAVIGQRNLFGSTDKAVAVKNSETGPTEGPDLSTLITVRGTVAGTGKDGFAVIEEKGTAKQTLYKVGNVVSGAKVTRISRNSVSFLVGGQEKVLKMVEANVSPTGPVRPTAQPPVLPTGGAPMVVSKSEVETSLKDMGTMLSQAQVRPYYSNGTPDGFIITNIRPGSIYEKIGLREGDIVQAANDRRLVTADDVTAFYNTMKSGTAFSLTIKRGGQQQNLQYQFR